MRAHDVLRRPDVCCGQHDAPDAAAAAQYYPANYWYALVEPPAATDFPGTGGAGNGIAPAIRPGPQS